jgi:hypothetical protein
MRLVQATFELRRLEDIRPDLQHVRYEVFTDGDYNSKGIWYGVVW